MRSTREIKRRYWIVPLGVILILLFGVLEYYRQLAKSFDDIGKDLFKKPGIALDESLK
jgi:hypothetical protein